MTTKCSFKRPDLDYNDCNNLAIGFSPYNSPVCNTCAVRNQIYIKSKIQDSTPPPPTTFLEFSQANRKRCETTSPNGFGESLGPGSNYGPEHWALAVGEETGEVIGAGLGMTGRKARKKHLTKVDVLKEIGDVGACLDLLAQSLSRTLGECMVQKFNEVSDRIGSDIKL